MFASDDTIVAIATPLGRGAIGMVRLSGPAAAAIASGLSGRARPLVARRATFARLTLRTRSLEGAAAGLAQDALLADQVVLTFFPAPHSYTGEDVVEITAHGSSVVLQGLVAAACGRGARLAQPGEFTLRAFLNGKLDLVQAEAVADLVDAVTPLQARAAFDQLEGTLTTRIAQIEAVLFDLLARLEASLDFPEEGYHFVERAGATTELATLRGDVEALMRDVARGRLIRDGAHVVIVGAPNVGKSSLFNALVGASRAIVTPVAGTTRDLLTERVNLEGLSITLVDSAGIRESTEPIEQEGIARSRGAMGVADLTVVVLDRSRVLEDDDRALLDQTAARLRVVVANKVDLANAWVGHEVPEAVSVSAATGVGLDAVVREMARALGGGEVRRDPPLVTNVRHATLLGAARDALVRAERAVAAGVGEEFVAADLQEAAHALQEITGVRTTDDLLAHIFARFCIGK